MRASRSTVISNNATVDDAFAWKTLLLEPGYLTAGRASDKDVVTIGTISSFGLVVPRRIRNEFQIMFPARLDLGSDDKKTYDRLGLAQEARAINCAQEMIKTYRELRDRKADIIVQPSSAIGDELMTRLQKLINQGAISSAEEPPTEISTLKAIRAAMFESTQKNPWAVAMLDWNFAVDMVECNTGEFDLYVGKFNSLIPVGYFYPKGDSEWGDILKRVLEQAIMNNSENLVQLNQFLNRSLVDVIPKPTRSAATLELIAQITSP